MSFLHFDPSSKHDRRLLAQKTTRTWRQVVTWILAPLLIGIAGVSMANISRICYEINQWISCHLGWGAVVYMPAGYAR
ncbi:MAG: chloride channel protein, partial [Oxalobacter sp.]